MTDMKAKYLKLAREQYLMEPEMTDLKLNRPHVSDNGRGTVLVSWERRQIRAWSYQNDDERRKKMLYAREYIEGWIDGREHGQTALFLRSLHIRHELFELFKQRVDNLSVDELHKVVDRLVPKSLPDQKGEQ